MPLYLADVLDDPELMTPFEVTRATQGVDTKGRTQLVQQNFDAAGEICPATPEQLERLPEADRSTETIAILTGMQLTAGSDTLAPDTVTWRGGTYKVVSVQDWSGFGFYEVLAQSDTMQGKDVTG